MSSPKTSEDGDFDLVDYIMFQKLELKDTSENAKVQVSDSYGIATVFQNKTGEYPVRKGANRKFVEIAPSFFVSCGEVRAGGHGLGHGIVYEGCWVTYKDEVMCGKDEVSQGENKVVYGTARLQLKSGKSFTVLCREVTFRTWFSKVLNGDFAQHDFDTVPLDILTSLTSPNSPGSLASENPAGLSPFASVSIALADNRPSQDHTANYGAAVSTLQALLTLQATPDAAASLTSENQPTNQATSVDKDENVILIQDDSEVTRHSDLTPSTQVQVSSKARTSTKRKIDLALGSLDKRTKTSSTPQQPIIIDLSSDDDDATILPSAGHVAQDIIGRNNILMKENERLRLAESIAANRANAAMGRNEDLARQNEKLRQDIETCKVSELYAVTKATEASGKIEDLMRLKQKLMDERENFKLSVMGAVRDVIDKDEGLNGQIKNDDHAGKIKSEEHTG